MSSMATQNLPSFLKILSQPPQSSHAPGRQPPKSSSSFSRSRSATPTPRPLIRLARIQLFLAWAEPASYRDLVYCILHCIEAAFVIDNLPEFRTNFFVRFPSPTAADLSRWRSAQGVARCVYVLSPPLRKWRR